MPAMANQDTPAGLVKANAQLAESGPTDNEWIHVKDIKHEAYKRWKNQDIKQERNKRNVRETKCTARRIRNNNKHLSSNMIPQ